MSVLGKISSTPCKVCCQGKSTRRGQISDRRAISIARCRRGAAPEAMGSYLGSCRRRRLADGSLFTAQLMASAEVCAEALRRLRVSPDLTQANIVERP